VNVAGEEEFAHEHEKALRRLHSHETFSMCQWLPLGVKQERPACLLLSISLRSCHGFQFGLFTSNTTRVSLDLSYDDEACDPKG
jgi:hypothetical protein